MDADIGPKVERVFYNMLSKPYHGRVKFTHLSKMSPRDFPDDEEVQAKRIWFEENGDTFALFRNVGRKIVMCGIKVKEAKLCEKYLQQQLADGESKCEDADCSLLHLCMGFFDERCTSEECKLSHSLDDDHNKDILKLPVFRKFSLEDQIKIIRLSQPEVCLRYNEDGICNYKDECTRLHICTKFLLGKCDDASAAASKVAGEETSCKLSHKLTETHSLHLLQTFGVWYNPNNVPGVQCQIMAPKMMADRRNKKEGKRSKQIGFDDDFFEQCKGCLDQLDRLINKDKVLPNEETFAKKSPSIWSVELFDTWFDFDVTTGERIESSFCDPKSDGITVRVPKEVLELIPECQEMTLTFDDNTSLLDDGNQLLPIRRLVPDESKFESIYLWYYLDKDNQWNVLDQNDVIETGFNNKEKRVNINFEDGRMFRLKFEDMTLKDRNDGDVYKVRRRPVQIK